MQIRRVCVVSIVLIAAAGSWATAAKRGVSPGDYFSFESIGEARISPDGKQAAWVLTTVDQAKNRRESLIWVVGTDGQSAPHDGGGRQFRSSCRFPDDHVAGLNPVSGPHGVE